MTDGTSRQTQYLTVPEVAKDLRVTPMTIYRMIAKGDLLAIQVGTRTYRIPAAEYHEYKRQRHADAHARAHQAGRTEVPF